MLRLASAAVLLTLVVVTIWLLPYWATGVLACVAAAIAGAELAGFSAAVGAPVPAAFLGASAALMVVAFGVDARFTLGEPHGVLGIAFLALTIAAAGVTLSMAPPGPGTLTRAAVLVMGPAYIGLPLGAMVWVQWAVGYEATLWMLAIIAISDSAQYYSGRRFGKTRLAPTISPAKTREGAVGGLVAAAAAGALLQPWWLSDVPVVQAAGMALVLAVFGITGDLFESMLKRGAGVKDSSTLIPGHGGVLDRIDSHLFAAPVFYLFMRFL
ncbi:MAG: phosphatidate cytidylyltransferase [Vicinamibacterales bacterium]